jgi:Ca2+-binding RTX toxin-like protein
MVRRGPRWAFLFTVVLVVAALAVPVGADEGADGPATIAAGIDRRASSDVSLVSGVLRDLVDRVGRGEQPQRLESGNLVTVEVLHTGDREAVEQVITSLGGVVRGGAGAELVEARVPVQHLEALEADKRVRYLRTPIAASMREFEPAPATGPYALDVAGEEVAKIGAAAWHAVGYTGQGIKIGIIDDFDGALWSSAQAAGEVPFVPPGNTLCIGSCDIWSGTSHGVAVAEIIHEVAPSAELFLVSGVYPFHEFTASDLQFAVDFFAANGVSIISHSATAEFDGPGDGTGPLADVIDSAVAQGMAWFNSAGNTASDAIHLGQYWRGPFQDLDGDTWMEFGGVQEYLEFDSCGLFNGVRWNDWGETEITDYDVFVVDTLADLGDWENAVVDSQLWQTDGADPVEYLGGALAFDDLRGPCDVGEQRIDYLQIQLYDAGAGTSDDIIEVRVNGSYLNPSTNDYSAAGPLADSASPGALAVGAIDPPTGTTVGYYSAWGPTNDGRIKPDLVAPAGVLSFAYIGGGWDGDGRFHGTSAATPAASGAAALVLQSGAAMSPAAVKAYLLGEAVVDRGPAGPDNQYGNGELSLPTPPDPVVTLTIASPDDGATVSDEITIEATAFGSVTGVVFKVDGSTIGTDFNPLDGWSQSWDTTGSADGSHTLSVEAVNDADVNDSIAVTVDNVVVPPPGLTITLPTAGSVVEGTITIVVESIGDVTGVQFEVDGAVIGSDTIESGDWRSSWNTEPYADGDHTITVRAVNHAAVTDSVTVTVDNPDPVFCRGLLATIVGTPGDDILNGTAGPDVMHGLGGNDNIQGWEGDDVICGGIGDDIIGGHGGDDLLHGESGVDVISGGAGDDELFGGSGNDSLLGGDGADLLRGQLGDDWSWGEAGDDRIQDAAGNDNLSGGEGKDKLWGGIGTDSLIGGIGRDQLHGGRDLDILYGGIDTDRMWGDAGDDVLYGEESSDFLYGGIGDDELWGGPGNDRLFGWSGTDTLFGNAGKDQLRGQAGDDIVNGGLHYDWCSDEPTWLNCEKPL